MLASLRLAGRSRVAALCLPALQHHLSPPQHQLAATRVQCKLFCSEKFPKPKTKVCASGETTESHTTKGKGGKNVNKTKSGDCCGSTKDASDKGPRGKTVVCDESQQKFAKEAADKEAEESEGSGKESECESESDREDSESSEEEEAKAPTKECPDAEYTESDDEEKHKKAASEMCDCVKSAVAKAMEQKGKDGKNHESPKAIDKPGLLSTEKDKAADKPKASKHVSCCNVERSKNAAADVSVVERCKSFKRDKPGKDGTSKATDSDATEQGDSRINNSNKKQCDCINQALDRCKQRDSPKPPPKKPDPPKPTDPKKPKEPKKPDVPKKPDTSKPKGNKDCKKKKPVVICK